MPDLPDMPGFGAGGEEQHPEERGSNTGVIIGGAVAGVIVAVIIVGIVMNQIKHKRAAEEAARQEAERQAELARLPKVDKKEQELQAELNIAIMKAKKVAREKPDDVDAQIAAWQAIMDDSRFAGAKGLSTVRSELEELKLIRAGQDKVGKEKYRATVARSDAVRADGDFDRAVRIIEAYLAANPQTADRAKADAKIAEIKAACAAKLADAEKASKAAMDASDYAAAVKALEDLKASVKSAGWLKDVPAKIDAVKAAVKAAAEKEMKDLRGRAGGGDLAAVAARARELAGKFRGTGHDAAFSKLADDVGSLPGLRTRFLAAIAKDGSKKLTVKLETPLLATATWSVKSADANAVTFTGEHAGLKMEAKREWKELSARDRYTLYTLYNPQPTAEDHRVLALFCSFYGLTAEAKKHTGGQ
jgi:hypothetical protein